MNSSSSHWPRRSPAAFASADKRRRSGHLSDNLIKIGVLTAISSLLRTSQARIGRCREVSRSRIRQRDAGYKVEVISADAPEQPDFGSGIAASGTTPTRST